MNSVIKANKQYALFFWSNASAAPRTIVFFHLVAWVMMFDLVLTNPPFLLSKLVCIITRYFSYSFNTRQTVMPLHLISLCTQLECVSRLVSQNHSSNRVCDTIQTGVTEKVRGGLASWAGSNEIPLCPSLPPPAHYRSPAKKKGGVVKAKLSWSSHLIQKVRYFLFNIFFSFSSLFFSSFSFSYPILSAPTNYLVYCWSTPPPSSSRTTISY